MSYQLFAQSRMMQLLDDRFMKRWGTSLTTINNNGQKLLELACGLEACSDIEKRVIT